MAPTNRARPAIAESDVFAGLEPSMLTSLESVATLQEHAAGTPIFRLGEDARMLLVIASGTVGLTIPVPVPGRIDDVLLEEKGPGEVIAWSALVPPHRYTLGATARTDTALHAFDRDALRALLERDRELHRRVLDNLNRVIASRVMLLEAVVARDLGRRVAEKYA